MAYVNTGYVADGYVEDLPPPSLGYPSPSNVRLGVVYGASNEYTGTYVTPDTQATVDALIAALQLSVVPVNLVQVRGQSIGGSGIESDPWRPA